MGECLLGQAAEVLKQGMPKINSDKFEKLYDSLAKESRETLVLKAKEYVRNDDRLHNFKRAAEMNRTTPARALKGMWDKKHLVSVCDIVDDVDAGKEIDLKVAREKILDTINYAYLFWAVLNEK